MRLWHFLYIDALLFYSQDALRDTDADGDDDFADILICEGPADNDSAGQYLDDDYWLI